MKESEDEKVLEYEKGSVSGYVASDHVCLSTNTTSCAEEQIWLAIGQSRDLDAMKADGILGLSPGKMEINGQSLLRGEKSKGFIDNLYDQGIIKERVFSFFLSDYNDYRQVPMFTVGGYDMDKFAPNQTATWNYVTDTTYWTVRLSSVYLGDKKIPLTSSSAIIDTGTSYLAVPE